MASKKPRQTQRKPTEGQIASAHVSFGPFEDDRTIAIKGGALVEAALERYLRHVIKRFSDGEDQRLFGYGGPLRDFYSMTAVAYAFGVIDRGARQDLDIVRNVRNRFAHDLADLRFTDERIGSLCKGLRSSATGGSNVVIWFVNACDKLYENFWRIADVVSDPDDSDIPERF